MLRLTCMICNYMHVLSVSMIICLTHCGRFGDMYVIVRERVPLKQIWARFKQWQ